MAIALDFQIDLTLSSQRRLGSSLTLRQVEQNLLRTEQSRYCLKRARFVFFQATMKNKTYYIYILASDRNGTLYIGVTSNLIQRIYQHKQNDGWIF